MASKLRADEVEGDLRVRCDIIHQKFDMDNRADVPDKTFKVYDLNKFPTYICRKKGLVVCDVGNEAKISLTAGISPNNPHNNNVSVSINDEFVGSMNFVDDVQKLSIAAENRRVVHVKTCRKFMDEPELCKTDFYSTRFSPTSPQTASFDCQKAATVVEQLVCDDGLLAADDRAMASIFRKAMTTAVDKKELLRTQRFWLKYERHSDCSLAERGLYPADLTKAKACLRKAYDKRLDQLRTLSDPKQPASTTPKGRP